jgi:hypothetical protein
MTQAALPIESSISSSPDEVEVVLVSKEQRNPIIDRAVRGCLESSLERTNDRITIEQMFYLLDSEMAQLFLAVEGRRIIAAVITEFVEFVSGRRSLKVIVAGGEKGYLDTAVEPFLKKIEEVAMLGVCSSVLVEGRKGWGRVLSDGYKFSHSVFEKELL